MENNFKITVYKNDEIDAFGAYASPSITQPQGGIILMNIEALLGTSIDEGIPFREVLVETLMHEVGHALEQWYNLEFSEDRIDKITASYCEKYYDKMVKDNEII